uniref:Putative zinc finger CCCH domain-containing protein 17 isoform X1 n=1 Tax=Davidia involucrata TaxID=16924 RepID=A0A5B7CDF7_DAVIN
MVGATQQPQLHPPTPTTTTTTTIALTSAEEEALKRNTDCVYFLASPLTCKKGSDCEYRHSDIARVNPRDCWFWLNGNCLNPKCGFRHPVSFFPYLTPTSKYFCIGCVTDLTNKPKAPGLMECVRSNPIMMERVRSNPITFLGS